jgi:GNAT superfamily N-acetyltransferase
VGGTSWRQKDVELPYVVNRVTVCASESSVTAVPAVGGVALLGLHQAPRGWHATLDDLAVAPELRRQGIGRALLGAAASLARARACRMLQVAFPAEDPDTRAFLSACGLRGDLAMALRI